MLGRAPRQVNAKRRSHYLREKKSTSVAGTQRIGVLCLESGDLRAPARGVGLPPRAARPCIALNERCLKRLLSKYVSYHHETERILDWGRERRGAELAAGLWSRAFS
jgi:hypothetical protein